MHPFPDSEILLALDVLNSDPSKSFSIEEIYKEIKDRSAYPMDHLDNQYNNQMGRWATRHQTNPVTYQIVSPAGINKLEQLKNEEKIRQLKEQIVFLEASVHESTLLVHESITKTNESVKTTNDSVRGANKISRIDLQGQKRVIMVTLVIAVLGLLFQVLTFIKDYQDKKIPEQLENIDSTLQQMKMLPMLKENLPAYESIQAQSVKSTNDSL